MQNKTRSTLLQIILENLSLNALRKKLVYSIFILKYLTKVNLS